MKKLVVILITILFVCGCQVKVKPVEQVTDSEIVSFEYSLPEDHPFTYLNLEELMSFLDDGTGILVFTNSSDELNKYIIKLLNDVLNDLDIDKIYYYDSQRVTDLTDEMLNKLKVSESELTGNTKFYLLDRGHVIDIYDLDSFDLDNLATFSNLEFEQKIKEFYRDMICEIYSDKCDNN